MQCNYTRNSFWLFKDQSSHKNNSSSLSSWFIKAYSRKRSFRVWFTLCISKKLLYSKNKCFANLQKFTGNTTGKFICLKHKMKNYCNFTKKVLSQMLQRELLNQTLTFLTSFFDQLNHLGTEKLSRCEKWLS